MAPSACPVPLCVREMTAPQLRAPSPSGDHPLDCKWLQSAWRWPRFDVAMEAEYKKSMLPYRLRAMLLYDACYVGPVIIVTVRNWASPAMVPCLCMCVLFLLAFLPMLGLLPGRWRCLRALAGCLARPRLVCLLHMVHVGLFVASLLQLSQSEGESTIHLLVLWFLTIVGASGVFDFHYFVALVLATTTALFCTHPGMEKNPHYFVQVRACGGLEHPRLGCCRERPFGGRTVPALYED